MPLINARNSGPRSADMVEHGLGDLEADTKPLKASGERPPQVMEPPRRDGAAVAFGNQLIELLLAFGVAGEAGARRSRENASAARPIFAFGDEVKFSDRQVIQRDRIRFAILCPMAWQTPLALLSVQFFPVQARDFFPALAGDDQKANDRPETPMRPGTQSEPLPL